MTFAISMPAGGLGIPTRERGEFQEQISAYGEGVLVRSRFEAAFAARAGTLRRGGPRRVADARPLPENEQSEAFF